MKVVAAKVFPQANSHILKKAGERKEGQFEPETSQGRVEESFDLPSEDGVEPSNRQSQTDHDVGVGDTSSVEHVHGVDEGGDSEGEETKGGRVREL